MLVTLVWRGLADLKMLRQDDAEIVKWRRTCEKNARTPEDADIATRDSAVRIPVIHTQEDWEIAAECWRLVAPQSKKDTSFMG